MTFLAAMVLAAALDALRPSAEKDRQERERLLLGNLRRDKQREAKQAKKLQAELERQGEMARVWRVNHETTAEEWRLTRIVLSASATPAERDQAVVDREELQRELMRADGLDLPLLWEHWDRNWSQQ
jgi:hypothetical protein